MSNIRASGMVLVAAFFSAVGLLSFAAHLLFRPESQVLIQVISLYRELVDKLPLEWFSDIALRVVRLLSQLDVHLDPDWKYFIVPALFYFSADSKVFASKNRPGAAAVSITLGVLISLVLSISISLASSEGVPVAVTATVVSFTLYSLLMSAIDPALKEKSDYTWLQQFKYYTVRWPAIDAVVGIILIILAMMHPGKEASLALIFVYLIVLTLRDFAVAALGALRNPVGDEPWRKRIWYWGSFHLGLNKLLPFAIAAVLLVLDRAAA